MIVQILRRLVQLAVVLVVIGMPMLSLYAHYRAARAIDDEQLMAGLAAERAMLAIHPYIDRLADPQAFLDANKGTLWSMRLMDVELSDPLAGAEVLAASKVVHWPFMLSLIIPIALTLILGRVFCSWMCPAYLMFELTGKLRRLLRFAEISPGEIRFSHVNKYALLAVGLLVAAVTAKPLFAHVYPPAVISRGVHAWFFGTSLAGVLVLLGLLVAMELFVSPRWWCRTMCPGGALYGLFGWLRPVRVRLAADKCTGCNLCQPVCEMGIDPVKQSASIECDNCAVCIRHCPEKALYFTIGLPGRAARNQPRAKVKAAACAVAVLFALAFSQEAEAHHILGLPHYSYKENYPQRPTLEYPAMTGPYDVLLTSYPGIPVPGEPANLAVYIKNRETNEVYSKLVTLRVLKTSTFGDNTIIVPPTPREPYDNEYKYHVTFPTDGEYIVELSLPVEGRTEVIPFLMIVGAPTGTASFAIMGAFGLVVVFVIIRAVQKKRRRRSRAGQTESVAARTGVAI